MPFIIAVSLAVPDIVAAGVTAIKHKEHAMVSGTPRFFWVCLARYLYRRCGTLINNGSVKSGAQSETLPPK
jgi:hypothetical protein